MTKENFEKLKKIVAEEMIINEDNVIKKSIQLSTYHHRYTDLYCSELKKLKCIELVKDQLYGKIYNELKFGKNDFTLSSKGEYDIYIRANQDYINNCLEFQEQEIVVKYLEMTLESINKSGFFIKNYCDLLKLKQG